jgi:serine/threonine-protein phosphatase 2A regulatory subunit A
VEDEDEVLLALAEELGGLIGYIGGPTFSHALLAPLENLATVEETVVRDKAIESISKVAAVLKWDQIEHYYIPMLKKLSSGDWFTSRCSACALFAVVYDKCPANVQDELRK